jgi:4-hydroxy-2-oxoheptanedioate aldolase
MNIIERSMIEQLTELREKYGVFEIKAEFEAEGSTMEEMMRLKDVTTAAGLPILLKLGGVEAVTDIYCALQIGVKGIVAPMAETAFALSKYIDMVIKIIPPDNAEDIQFAFNLETLTGCHNFKQMLALPNIGILFGVTIGRVDLTGSMGLDRKSVDTPQIFDLTRDACILAKEKGLHTAVGGAISADSIDFINRLHSERLLDKFETRKVVFHAESVQYGEIALNKAIHFELNWLKAKQRFHSRVRAEDAKRIEMLEKRVSSR